ncbi:hypothetical protein [Plantactinospora sonchi]|uniref:Lipoprotein n=1 Tax=Plantactinospora sonchi TaxID=1544735 RepID=A0ABU7RPK5_9ACTN
MTYGTRGRTGNGPTPLLFSGLLAIGLLGALAGCAESGTPTAGTRTVRVTAGPASPDATVAPPVRSTPPYRCSPTPAPVGSPGTTPGSSTAGIPVTDAPVPDLGATGTVRPPTEQELAEQFGRNEQANKTYRIRGQLGQAAAGDATVCARQVQDVLDGLRKQERYDAAALTRALGRTPLTDIVVRPPGRLDASAGDGLLFAGWTGHACVFGSHGESGSTVEIGARIADGGCLPAPD